MPNKAKADVIGIFDNFWLETLQQVTHDIYHLPGYVALEAKRSKTIPEAILISEGNKIFFVPYLIRQCDNILNNVISSPEIYDVISPYGYPGILISNEAAMAPAFIKFAISELKLILKYKRVCSAFFRLHPLINDKFSNLISGNYIIDNGQTVSVDLTLPYEQLWNQTKPDRRNKINKCKRLGFSSRIVSFYKYISEFIEIYEDTMRRVGAKQVYFEFDYQYCINLKEVLGDKLHLCIVEFEDKIASAGLYTEYNGIVQALFGGTRTEFVKYSPSSLETDYMRLWAKERGNKLLHLGGGLGGTKNSLYDFKAGFSKLKHSFQTMRLIIDEDNYNYLLTARAKSLNIDLQELINSNFFPAYRALDSLNIS